MARDERAQEPTAAMPVMSCCPAAHAVTKRTISSHSAARAGVTIDDMMAEEPASGDALDRAVYRQVRVAVVSVTTSGLVTTPPKSFRMKDSISSSSPSLSDSAIIWVPEYESIRLR